MYPVVTAVGEVLYIAQRVPLEIELGTGYRKYSVGAVARDEVLVRVVFTNVS